jgi:OOP family OmpA-OmpF porin
MKKNLLLLSIFLLGCIVTKAQVVETSNLEVKSINKWSIEVNAGQSKGVKPYSEGYYSGNPNKFLGRFQVNTFGIGARYMISPKFGIKFDLAYDKLDNENGSGSLPFQMLQYRTGFQGVINAIRLFGIEEASGRFGLLLHGGIQISRMTSKTNVDILGNYHNYDKTESNGGIIIGFSPQFRITKSLALTTDFSVLSNYRQHFNWDGSYSDGNNNLSGQMITTTFGLSYSFGKDKIHGDWAIIQEKNIEKIEELDKRIGDLETMMNDADKDGVPDYLDVENNSTAGIAVDTKGRMVDLNNNGIPDELEKYMDESVTKSISQVEKSVNQEVIKKLINEGYIATYFESNKSKPTNASTENIAFILNYLRANPSATIDIVGHADEIGNSEFNNGLATERANSIKNILLKSGIDTSRINIVTSGEDTSVDKNSKEARSLVRRVTFTVK